MTNCERDIFFQVVEDPESQSVREPWNKWWNNDAVTGWIPSSSWHFELKMNSFSTFFVRHFFLTRLTTMTHEYSLFQENRTGPYQQTAGLRARLWCVLLEISCSHDPPSEWPDQWISRCEPHPSARQRGGLDCRHVFRVSEAPQLANSTSKIREWNPLERLPGPKIFQTYISGASS